MGKIPKIVLGGGLIAEIVFDIFFGAMTDFALEHSIGKIIFAIVILYFIFNDREFNEGLRNEDRNIRIETRVGQLFFVFCGLGVLFSGLYELIFDTTIDTSAGYPIFESTSFIVMGILFSCMGIFYTDTSNETESTMAKLWPKIQRITFIVFGIVWIAGGFYKFIFGIQSNVAVINQPYTQSIKQTDANHEKNDESQRKTPKKTENNASIKRTEVGDNYNNPLLTHTDVGKVFLNYYRAIGEKRYSDAYASLTPRAKKLLGGSLEAFANSRKNNLSIEIIGFEQVAASSIQMNANYRIRTKDKTDMGIYEQTFSGNVSFVKNGNQWFIDSIASRREESHQNSSNEHYVGTYRSGLRAYVLVDTLNFIFARSFDVTIKAVGNEVVYINYHMWQDIGEPVRFSNSQGFSGVVDSNTYIESAIWSFAQDEYFRMTQTK